MNWSFYHDLCSSCWFNYLLFYLDKIVWINSVFVALLVGQIADAIATPLIGYLSDRIKTKFWEKETVICFWFFIGDIGLTEQFEKYIHFHLQFRGASYCLPKVQISSTQGYNDSQFEYLSQIVIVLDYNKDYRKDKLVKLCKVPHFRF